MSQVAEHLKQASKLDHTDRVELISSLLQELDHSPVNSDPRVLGGTLVFRGTRVQAQTLLDYVCAGDSLDTFWEHFPTVDRQAAVEFLKLVHEKNLT